ncbi:hypothetical protein [Lichenicoccus sp.]|uniref:hypothetical protein n=1 Tax=Lichenicoccus sp. TaxID=2781899 RepID=UPI003D15020A
MLEVTQVLLKVTLAHAGTGQVSNRLLADNGCMTYFMLNAVREITLHAAVGGCSCRRAAVSRSGWRYGSSTDTHGPDGPRIGFAARRFMRRA